MKHFGRFPILLNLQKKSVKSSFFFAIIYIMSLYFKGALPPSLSKLLLYPSFFSFISSIFTILFLRESFWFFTINVFFVGI
jgi:hypothetical protein